MAIAIQRKPVAWGQVCDQSGLGYPAVALTALAVASGGAAPGPGAVAGAVAGGIDANEGVSLIAGNVAQSMANNSEKQPPPVAIGVVEGAGGEYAHPSDAGRSVKDGAGAAVAVATVTFGAPAVIAPAKSIFGKLKDFFSKPTSETTKAAGEMTVASALRPPAPALKVGTKNVEAAGVTETAKVAKAPEAPFVRRAGSNPLSDLDAKNAATGDFTRNVRPLLSPDFVGPCPDWDNPAWVAKKLEDYRRATIKMQDEIVRSFKLAPGKSPSIEDATNVRGQLFKDVYGRSADLRKKEVHFAGGHSGAPPARVTTEWRMMEAQMAEMERVAKTPEEKVAALAFWSNRATAIQPFDDGNKRTMRLMSAAKAEQMFGPGSGSRLLSKIEAAGFRGNMDALKSSLDPGEGRNLQPTAKMFGDALGIGVRDEPIPSPYRVTARFMDHPRDFIPTNAPASEIAKEIAHPSVVTGHDFFGKKLGSLAIPIQDMTPGM